MNASLVLASLCLAAVSSALADVTVSGSVQIGGGSTASAPSQPAVTPGKGPPPWAPAHGRRAKYSYRYYPGSDVYFRPADGVWVYYENGKWSVGAQLPVSLRIDVNRYVSLDMDTDKPYTFHNAVKSNYPAAAASVKVEAKATESRAPQPQAADKAEKAEKEKGRGKGKNKS